MNKNRKISQNWKLEIEFLAAKEPNNGRMLWEVNLFHDKENINTRIFDNNWNFLNYQLNLWQLENSEYYYIPKEGKAILYKKENLEKIELKYHDVSTLRFKGNIFHKMNLIEFYEESIEVTNLNNRINRSIKWQSKGILKTIEVGATDDIIITYKDSNLKELHGPSLDAIKLLEDHCTTSSDIDLMQLMLALKNIVSNDNKERLSLTTIDDLYIWFLPTSVWDDLTGSSGELLGSIILEKLETLKFGKKEVISMK